MIFVAFSFDFEIFDKPMFIRFCCLFATTYTEKTQTANEKQCCATHNRVKFLHSMLPGVKFLNGSVNKAIVREFDPLGLNHGLVLLIVCKVTSSKLTLAVSRANSLRSCV